MVPEIVTSRFPRDYRAILLLLGGVCGAALYALSRSNYLLYHALIEWIAVGVAIAVFTIGWNTHRYASSDSLFLLGVAYASVAGLDLVHTLAFKGMGVFPEYGPDLPTQLWMAARLVESLSLLGAALLVGKPTRLYPGFVLALYTAVTTTLILLILPLGWFPSMYIPGQGLTETKIAGEYIVCGILGLALVLFWRHRYRFSRHDIRFLLAAIAASMAAELSFTLYTDVYGFFNFLGHLFKLVSFACIYQALVSGVLRQPYEGIFQELVRSRDKLNQLIQLNADGIMVIDKQGVILFHNPAVADLYGKRESGLQGERFGYPLFPGKSTEIELLPEDGGTRVAELRATETEWEGASALLASLRDITQRKHMERELGEREQELETIYQNAPLLMMLMDGERKIRKTNAHTSRFLGEPLERIYGRRVGEALHCMHHLDDPRGCGYGTDCAQCPVRRTVMDTFQTGRIHNQVEASLSLQRQGEFKHLTFLVSTALLQHKNEPLVLVTIMDITERKEAEENLRHLSFHDSLTDLYNRNFFEAEMSRLSDGRWSPVGIVLCDLDGLKVINDTLGHQFGDIMLRNIADHLRATFRASDIIARIGGDEFAILVPSANQDIMEDLTCRLRQALQEDNQQKPKLPLYFSLGHAISERGSVDIQALFRDADNRMYREKSRKEDRGYTVAVQALTRALETLDFLAQRHGERLQEMVPPLARSMGMGEAEIQDLLLLARFHDLGKVGVPDWILFKTGPLTEDELREVRQHSEIGQRIAQSVPGLGSIADWIYKHHERWDGTGYPLGLRGEDIPLACRIFAVIEAFEVMTGERPYNPTLSSEEAIAELRRCSGSQFDPDVVEKFVHILQGSGPENTIPIN